MKNFILYCLKFLTLFVVVKLCKADTFSTNGTNSRYPGMCVFNDEPYPPGEILISKRCIKLICSQNGWMSVHSCIEKNLDKECDRLGYINIKSPFPDCCKRKYRCKDKNGIEYEKIDF